MKLARGVVLLLIMLPLLCCSCTFGVDHTNRDGDSSEGSEPKKEGLLSLEPYELVMAFPTFSNPKDMQLVEDELNKITRKKINTSIKLITSTANAYVQRMPLLLMGDEKLDILVSGFGQYYAQVGKGQLHPLNGLLDHYGQGVKQAITDQSPLYLEATYVNGESYGVPSIRDLATDYGFIMRKDLAQKYAIDVAAMKNLNDVEAALKILKEKEPNMTLAKSYDTTIGLYFERIWDNLGDNLGVVMFDDANLRVVNGFESEEYKEIVTRLHHWYNAGFIARDAATSTIGGAAEVKAGTAYGYLAQMKPGYEAQESKASGYEMVAVRLMPPTSSTGNVTGLVWSIADQSENPERAMMFLNLMYSDPDVINLFSWGIEGKHYVKVEGTDHVIDFPKGVNAINSGYQLNMGWMFGNPLLSYVWNGEDPRIWSKLSDFNRNARTSPVMGFSFNPDPVKAEILAATEVLDQYRVAFETGTVSPNKLPEFNAALKASGLDVIIAE
ncbi:MAG: ABC transporter substrate-binding protein, partial [Cohnella sp.]|nr:ABC transporter substrate-binding protein [Cohnella sp.]